MSGLLRIAPRQPLLMLIVDGARLASEPERERMRQAVEAGGDMVQLRDRTIAPAKLIELGRILRGLCVTRPLLINDRADVALLCGADGVHLPEDGLPGAAVRKLLPRSMLVGRSVHSVESARQAERDGVNYILAGTIFASPSHPEREPSGVGLVEEITRRVSVPLLAVGGMTPEGAALCVRAGAHGVAVISAVLDANEPAAVVRSFRSAMGAAAQERQPDEAQD